MMEFETNWAAEIGVALGFGIVCLLAASFWKRNRSREKVVRRIPRKWRPVAKVESLTVYPLKACKGMRVSTVHVEDWALRNGKNVDRQFMLVNGVGNLVCGRTHPKCVLISAEVLPEDRLRLTAPDMPPFEIEFPSEEKLKTASDSELEVVCNLLGRRVKAMNLGAEVSQWLTEYLILREGRDLDDGRAALRLVYHHLAAGQRRPIPRELELLPLSSIEDKSLFQNSTNAAHLLSVASVDDLNEKLKEIDVKMSADYFRPNIVVSGCAAFEEDEWDFVKIGDAVFRRTAPCGRCTSVTVDPANGKRLEKGQPLTMLRKYRKDENPDLHKLFNSSPKFGTMLAVNQKGTCSVGDVVYVGM